MGVRTPKTCRAVNKRQDNKPGKLLHLVGDLFEPLSKLSPCCIKPLACKVLVVSLHGKAYCKDWRLDIRKDGGRGPSKLCRISELHGDEIAPKGVQ
jgi:hypothetical protein